jgi:glycosyltransferase involved in cell wall biosynthesis
MDKNAGKNSVAHFKMKPSGCYWYRVKQPMEMLESKGINIIPVQLDTDILQFDTINSFQFYGAFPFSTEKVLGFIKKEGKKVIYDADDPLDIIDLSNPFYYSVKKDLGSANECIDMADEITVSTPAMKEYMQGKTYKKITVVPNCYTPSEWRFPKPKREGIRIGFAGSATHVVDLIDIIPVIKNLQDKFPEVIFIIYGFGQGDYDTWFKEFRYVATDEAKELLTELDKRLATIKFEWVPYTEFTMYPSVLTNMALDIGLCPLKETPFNKCRSACKAMEYTLAGALAIASDVEAYRNDDNSIKVKDNEWEEVLTHYIQSPEGRAHEHAKHLKWTQENRNIDTQYEKLKDIYLN